MIFECQLENDTQVSFQPLLVQNLIKTNKQTMKQTKTRRVRYFYMCSPFHKVGQLCTRLTQYRKHYAGISDAFKHLCVCGGGGGGKGSVKHIISYHIISYHIISYHIISNFIPISYIKTKV